MACGGKIPNLNSFKVEVGEASRLLCFLGLALLVFCHLCPPAYVIVWVDHGLTHGTIRRIAAHMFLAVRVTQRVESEAVRALLELCTALALDVTIIACLP